MEISNGYTEALLHRGNNTTLDCGKDETPLLSWQCHKQWYFTVYTKYFSSLPSWLISNSNFVFVITFQWQMEHSKSPERSDTCTVHRKKKKIHSFCNVRCGLLVYLFYSIFKSLEYEEMFEHGKQNETTSLCSDCKNLFYEGPAGVTKQQGRAESLEMHKAFSSKGKVFLLLHAISSYGVWSEGLGGCDHAWKSSLYQVRNIYVVELRTKCIQDIFFP